MYATLTNAKHQAANAPAAAAKREFDTVILDEAARANPLDLMIPMSLAGERKLLPAH